MRRARLRAAVGLAAVAAVAAGCSGGGSVKAGPAERDCGTVTQAANGMHIVDGASARSCLMFAVQAEGASITTVEGLAPEGELNDLQRAFQAHHALQCGFCTPGLLTTAHVFLQENPRPTPDEVRAAISGNICRCTGYLGIVEAILATAAARAKT